MATPPRAEGCSEVSKPGGARGERRRVEVDSCGSGASGENGHGTAASAPHDVKERAAAETAAATAAAPRWVDTPSRALPRGWHEAISPDSRTYYYNADTGQTQWEPPAVSTTRAARTRAALPAAAADATADGKALSVASPAGAAESAVNTAGPAAPEQSPGGFFSGFGFFAGQSRGGGDKLEA